MIRPPAQRLARSVLIARLAKLARRDQRQQSRSSSSLPKPTSTTKGVPDSSLSSTTVSRGGFPTDRGGVGPWPLTDKAPPDEPPPMGRVRATHTSPGWATPTPALPDSPPGRTPAHASEFRDGSSGTVKKIAAGEPPPGSRYDEAVYAVTAQAVCERLLAGDHVVLQRCELKQPARDFMTVAHVGRMLGRRRDRSVPGNLWKVRLRVRNRCGYRRQD